VWIGLVWIPLAYSLLFFAIPAARSVGVRRRNRLHRKRNLRKLTLGTVFEASLAGNGAGWVSLPRARKHIQASLPKAADQESARHLALEPSSSGRGPLSAGNTNNAFLEAELQNLLAEFDGEVEESADGVARYRFPSILDQIQGAEMMRRRLDLGEQRVGDIVYASDDTAEEAHERDLAAFDRELGRPKDLSKYLQAPERVGFLDDFELVAFD
jgi:hypothetical protein